MLKKMFTILTIVLLLSISLLPNAVSDDYLFGNVIYVNDDGGADYTSIQDAIDEANAGDTIYVYSGTYYENVIVNKSISLVGEYSGTTIIDGRGVNDTILIDAEWVTVSNLCAKNNSINSYQYGGIHTKADYTTIIDNYVLGYKLQGIVIESQYNMILGNQVEEGEYGILTRYANNNIIVNNFINNTIPNGIYLAVHSSNNTVYNNIVTKCNDAFIITDSNNNIIRENIADSNERNGIEINPGKRNIVYDNTFSNNGYNGAELLNAVGNIIYNNNFLENDHNNKDWDGGNHWYIDYPEGGNYWDDYYNGIDDYHGPDQNIPGSDGIWDDPYLISIYFDIDKYPYAEPNGWLKESVGSDLDCLGMLSWDSVKPNTEQTGRILLFNNGESGSLLDWEVEGLPEWGGCIITPDNGEDLSPEDGYVPLTITITAPDEQEQSFSGEIKIVNKDNSNDYHVFTVSLTTAKTKTRMVYSLFLQFLENHPLMFPILRQLLRLNIL